MSIEVRGRGDKALKVVSVIAMVVVWQLLSMTTSDLFLPGPVKVFVGSWDLYHEVLLSSVAYSIMRVVLGFLLGSIIGVVTAILMSWNHSLEALIDPIVEVLRPVPVLALIPLFILWFGLGELGKVLLIATGSFVILVVSTRESIRNVKPVYLKAAQTLGASRRSQVFRTVIIPSITPEVIAGFRVAAAASFGLVAAAEFLGAQQGIGYIIIQARRFLYTHGVIFGIVLFSVLSWMADQGVRYVDRRVNRWTERSGG